MPLLGNVLPLLAVSGILHPLEAIIEVSTEDVTIKLGFPPCDMPGVGIIVPMEEDELTSSGCRWV